MKRIKKIDWEGVWKLNIPEETGKTTTTIEDGKIAFTRIDHDDFIENPCEEDDYLGRIYSLSNRHVNHDPRMIESNLGNPDAVRLSYFEHSLCRWGIQGSMGNMPDFLWDGVGFAGIWLPNTTILDEARTLTGTERREFMEKRAANACETYTQWCNGEVYWFWVVVYELRRYPNSSKAVEIHSFDYYERSPFEPLFEDSCGGFYGWDSVREEVERIAQLIDEESETVRPAEERGVDPGDPSPSVAQ